jgi:MtN3 and saliva related transmembrane protein
MRGAPHCGKRIPDFPNFTSQLKEERPSIMLTDITGWTSALILLLTISRQVYTQWRSRSTAGVSHWLFIGQLAASTGFVIYSYLVENWVFVATNFFMLLVAITGQLIYRSNKLREERKAKAGNAALARQ